MLGIGNKVKIVAPNGAEYIYNSLLDKSAATLEKQQLEDFIRSNGAAAGGTLSGGKVR